MDHFRFLLLFFLILKFQQMTAQKDKRALKTFSNSCFESEEKNYFYDNLS